MKTTYQGKQVFGIDTETHRIKPGVIAPKLVCVSVYDGQNDFLFDAKEGIERFRSGLEKGFHFVFHNACFDLGVFVAEDMGLFPLIIKAIENNQIHCTKIRQMILDNAMGELKFEWDEDLGEFKKSNFSLHHLVMRWFEKDITKSKKDDDAWRMRYGELDGTPIEEWPDAAKKYAIDDAKWSFEVFRMQVETEKEGLAENQRESRIVARSFALQLDSIWGFRTNKEAVDKLRQEISAQFDAVVKIGQKWGFVRADKTRDTKAIQDAIQKWADDTKSPIKYTATGKVGMDSQQLAEITCIEGHTESECQQGFCPEGPHQGLWAIRELSRLSKLLNTYIRALERGVDVPVCPNYNPMVETFRTSCSQGIKFDGVPMGFNVQNPPRGDGIRDCLMPRPGYMYAFCDYDTLEMRTLGQVCIDFFGYSNLAETFKEGKDTHIDFAADLVGMTYEEFKNELDAGNPEMAALRQGAKIGNYGMAGGMGVDSFVSYAKGFGQEISHAFARQIHRGYRQKWRETNDYFAMIGRMIGGRKSIETLYYERTGYARGNVIYTAACNHFFQHLAAIGATDAHWEVTKACYMHEDSPLFGCRPWLFMHDELGIEIPYQGKRASDAALELQRIMKDTMQKWVPDVPIEATVVLGKKWLKGAKPVWENGVLVPGKPHKVGKKTTWVVDS